MLILEWRGDEKFGARLRGGGIFLGDIMRLWKINKPQGGRSVFKGGALGMSKFNGP